MSAKKPKIGFDFIFLSKHILVLNSVCTAKAFLPAASASPHLRLAAKESTGMAITVSVLLPMYMVRLVRHSAEPCLFYFIKITKSFTLATLTPPISIALLGIATIRIRTSTASLLISAVLTPRRTF